VDPEIRQVAVRVAGEDVVAALTVTSTGDWDGRGVRLSLSCRLGDWSGLGPDLFAALRALMVELERDDGRIGVAGARADAWPSGMQADMGGGRWVYLHGLPSAGPPGVPTLEPASLDDVGTSVDQDHFQRQVE
jgi:hypothetical protein